MAPRLTTNQIKAIHAKIDEEEKTRRETLKHTQKLSEVLDQT